MLRIIQSASAGGAKSYYSTADYYSAQELAGQWRGEGAARLGLKGEVGKDAWDALCDNRDPSTGRVLTQRQKDNRRIGYDFNFHVPKSVSLLYSLTKDDRILDAFRESVDETMRDMESEVKTRVRKDGRNEDRTTGNMIWGEFIHFTARPVDGVPDPHLHAHCFVFNTTWDSQEQRWKAGQFAGLKRDAPYFEAVFHSRLARRLANLGLPIERTKAGWEIEGIPGTALSKFSRRTALIEEKAREKGITDDREKDGLGAKTRERKHKELSFEELREGWASRLSRDELTAVQDLGSRIGTGGIAEDERAAGEAVDRATEHCFERKSVVPERQLLAAALKQAVGKASLDAVQREVAQRNLITGERDGQRLATTREVLQEEKGMLDFARQGRGTCAPLGSTDHVFRRDWLNEGQRKAVRHVLGSRDRVILVRGAAGVGKTSMMQEAVEAIEAGGHRVHTFAPSASASRGVLREEGFANAETVARLLIDPKLQDEVRGGVLWIDEAGLLGGRTMAQVFDLADQQGARVILSGDRRQHGSVERGAALRLLETEAGLIPAEIKDIQRQKGSYKQAVQALSEGRTEDGFHQLDQLGWIREVAEADRYKALAADYVAAVNDEKSALVVSPTHREGRRITDEIRCELQRVGKLDRNERLIPVLENANLTVAERKDPLNYLAGDELVFHQNGKGYRKGQHVAADEGTLPLDQADKFQVFHAGVLPVAPGDLLRITRNGKTADGRHRLDNGTVFTVKAFDDAGNLVLTNGWTVSKDAGHLAHGYCLTSHASQGRTVDRVFIGQSSASFPASSQEQFYVSASRARERAVVYTDDKTALLDAVSQCDDRLTATELVSLRQRRERHGAIERIKQQLSTIAHEHVAETRRRDEVVHER